MSPARNLLRRHCDTYGGRLAGAISELNPEKAPLALSTSPLEEKEQEDDIDSSSTSTTLKERDSDPYKSWLQLGTGHSSTGTSTSQQPSPPISIIPIVRPQTAWGLRAPPMMMKTGYGFSHLGFSSRSSSCAPMDFRVVDLQLRPQVGLWFELKTAENQKRQPFLPQIPKSYLRIKDGRMTVRLLMKYLAKKLELDDESQVEIICRGQELLPILTLQYIRDNIWSTNRMVTMTMHLSLSIKDHVMILHYGRRA